MLLHDRSGGDHIARTNRLVDTAMHLGRVTQLLDRRVLSGSAPLLVKQGDTISISAAMIGLPDAGHATRTYPLYWRLAGVDNDSTLKL
jgi:hypothetical protein